MITPNRIVIGADGEAWNPRTAKAVYRITPQILFIRNDGWVLAAPLQYEHVAFNLWEGQWQKFQRENDPEPRPISDYIPSLVLPKITEDS